MPGRLYVGTSGFAYPDWAPRFYPSGMPAARLLEHYASRLPAVELNNTYYASPKAPKVATWVAATGPDFRFAVKAQRGWLVPGAPGGSGDLRAVADRAVSGVRGSARDGPVPRPGGRPARRREARGAARRLAVGSSR
jgi:hypothetical protein